MSPIPGMDEYLDTPAPDIHTRVRKLYTRQVPVHPITQ